MKQWFGALALGVLCSACGSSPGPTTSGSGTSVGTVNNMTLSIKDAIYQAYPNGTGGTNVSIVFSSFTNLCNTANASFSNTDTAQGTVLQFGLNFAASANFASGANITINANNTAKLGTLDNGANSNSISAQSGSIALTSVSSSAIKGTFNLTFNGNQTLTGSFTAGDCTPSTGSGSANGSVNGFSVGVQDATYSVTSSGGRDTLQITLSSADGICHGLENNSTDGNVLLLVISNNSNSPVTTGTYNVDGTSIVGRLGTLSGSVYYGATSGSIVVTTLTGSHAEGHYSLTFTQGNVQGNFSANLCWGISTLLTAMPALDVPMDTGSLGDTRAISRSADDKPRSD